MDFADVVEDPDIAEPFTIQRQTGQFGQGGWIPGLPTIIPAFGVVSMAKAKDLDMIPEGDLVSESIVVHTTTEMFVTNAEHSGTSDLLVWQGTTYRIMNVGNFSNRNYWKAIACRLAGD